MKLTKIQNHTMEVSRFYHAICRSFSINNNLYIANNIYATSEKTPKSLLVSKNIPIDLKPTSKFIRNEYNINVDFIDLIKSSKNPEDAVNTINTLLLFN